MDKGSEGVFQTLAS